ncbi:MAG: hypothetical protein HFJ54_02775 [Clostridia bacterium]|nr:hypothetical protein [Clostridia bacterium]
MEENKNKEHQEHVKIYDKEMYISQEKLRTIILIILVFVLGFVAGYFSKDLISENIDMSNNASYNDVQS